MESLSTQPHSDGKSDEQKTKTQKVTTERIDSRQPVQCNQSLLKT